MVNHSLAAVLAWRRTRYLLAPIALPLVAQRVHGSGASLRGHARRDRCEGRACRYSELLLTRWYNTQQELSMRDIKHHGPEQSLIIGIGHCARRRHNPLINDAHPYSRSGGCAKRTLMRRRGGRRRSDVRFLASGRSLNPVSWSSWISTHSKSYCTYRT